MRRWSWEILWLTGGFFSSLLAPWFFANVPMHGLLGVLAAAPGLAVFSCVTFGVLWGSTA